jgi:LPXTG-motif cell wall-anchored protein
MVTFVGDTIHWTLSGIHNPANSAVTDFSIIDVPGVGLNFASAILPAFTNGAGVTYDVRYRVAGSTQWRTHAQGVNAAAPFTFSLPQPGNLRYTEIRFDFGTVPAGFGLGNEIVVTFRVGNNAPNNTLVNNFIVAHNNISTHGDSPYRPIVVPPAGDNTFGLGDGNAPLGRLPQTGINSMVFWLGALVNITAIVGLGTLIYLRKNKKRK